MKLIPLTRGQYAMVDDEDYEELSKYKWLAIKRRGRFVAGRTVYTAGARERTILMHKVIAGFAMTCHIDGNGLNNQRANLRPTGVPASANLGMPDKRCSRCEEMLPASKFGTRGSGRLESQCVPCRRTSARDSRRRERGWYAPLECRACGDEFPRREGPGHQASICEPCMSNPGRETPCSVCLKFKPRSEFKGDSIMCRACRKERNHRTDRNYHLKKFGITYGEKEAMFGAQEGACASCRAGLPPMGVAGVQEPHVDHSHKTGKVRGLLCRGCNTAEGQLKRDFRNTFSLGLYQLNDGPYYGPITVISDLGTWTSAVETVDGGVGRAWKRT